MIARHSLFALTTLALVSIPSIGALTSDSNAVATTEAVVTGTVPAPLTPPKHRSHKYQVTITNLTRGQIFSPPVIALHGRSMTPFWKLGSAVSSEIAMIAEDAVNAPLIAKLKKNVHVSAVTELKGKNGPILPGETASVVIKGAWGRRAASRLSMIGMLVITNDAFYGLNGAVLPWGTYTATSPAYDAGSEENNEKCANIPGLPCGNPLKRATKNAEGYAHIHAGIHGIGDLSAAKFDWRNGVCRIQVRRVR